MRAMVMKAYGSPDVLQLQEVETPVPKDNEVLIRIHAATVTAGDCEMRGFHVPILLWLPLRLYMGIRKPRINILGQELAGEIESVGKEVTGLRPGDAVFAPTQMRLGAYADYITLPSSYAIAVKPANISFEEAAAAPTGGLNALYFMRKANIRPGESVLINGAGGSIGTFAVQLAKYFGAVVTAVDSGPKLDMLRSIGADYVIDFTQEDFTQNGVRYDVIFDGVGKSSFSRALRSLSPTGRYLLGNPSLAVMVRGLWTAVTSRKQVITGVTDYKPVDLDFLRELMEAGKVKTVIDKCYPLEELADAHRYVETGRKAGNLVITIAPPS